MTMVEISDAIRTLRAILSPKESYFDSNTFFGGVFMRWSTKLVLRLSVSDAVEVILSRTSVNLVVCTFQ